MCNVHDYLDYRKYLAASFKERQTRNSAYSLRAFARDLGITASLVCKILQDKDSMTLKTAETVAHTLRLNPDDKEYFMALVHAYRTNDHRGVHKLREMREFRSVRLVSDEAYQVPFDDFSVFLIVSLNNKIEATEEWAREFRRDPDELWKACERLAEAGYIEGSRAVGWTTNITHVLSDDRKLAANREYHRQYLMRAVEAFRKPPSERFFSTTFRTICEKDYESFCVGMRDLVEKFRVSDTLETKADKTYLVGFQVFPFTNEGQLPVGTVTVNVEPQEIARAQKDNT